MTRHSNREAEYAVALVLARKLKARGCWNHSGLRWRNNTRVLSRRELAQMALELCPEAATMGPYLESERFFNHLAFAALA